MNAAVPPRLVLPGQPQHDRPYIAAHRRAPGATAARPAATKDIPMPAQDSAGRDDKPHRGEAIDRQSAGQQRQPCPVRPCQPRMSPRPLTQGDRELMAQHEDLGILHHDSRRDNLSSDTARETIKKISIKPTSRQSSHLPPGRHRLPSRVPDAAPSHSEMKYICPGGIGFRHPQARRWIDARSTQDLPHSRRRNCHAELHQFAVDTAVSPQRILSGQTDHKAADAPACWRASRLAPLARVVLPRRRSCQASSVAGVTGKTSAQRLRGTSRVSAANQARSPGSYRSRPTCRRSTAFSCRSTSSSASFARSPQNTRATRLSTRHVSQ
jgi:hypothetical protein